MQAQPQSTSTSPEWHFHPLANQLGGFLAAQYISELYRSPETRVQQDPDYLFQKTKEILLNSGLDELEHLQFRETKLKKLCLDKLWEMTADLNPGHPRFQPEPDPTNHRTTNIQRTTRRRNRKLVRQKQIRNSQKKGGANSQNEG